MIIFVILFIIAISLKMRFFKMIYFTINFYKNILILQAQAHFFALNKVLITRKLTYSKQNFVSYQKKQLLYTIITTKTPYHSIKKQPTHIDCFFIFTFN